VKYGHDGGLERVFDHNLKDLSGMVLLFLEAIRLYDQRDGARGSLRSGLARILLRNRRSDEALRLLNHLEEEIQSSKDVDAEYADDQYGGLRYRDYLLLGQLYRARGRFADAASVFERVVGRYDCPYARMALAKLLEHRIKDYPGALVQTGELIRRFESAGGAASSGRGLYASAELQKRRARIERKLRRGGVPA
jgi:tetratricopeptide (TPR) repeat protein